MSRLLKLLPSWTIGGKGSKARKSTLSKESQPLELKTDKGLVHSATFSTKAPPPFVLHVNICVMVFAELPENAKCLMDCEAFEILQGIKEQMAVLSEDPSVKLPV